MPTQKDAEDFLERLNAEIVPVGGGKMAIKPDRLRELVRGNPEMTVAAAQAYLQTGKTEGRGFYQVAVALAAAFEAEFQDDSLSKLVAREIEKSGIKGATPEIRPSQASESHGPLRPEDASLIQVRVDAVSLQRADVYGLIRRFSIDRAEPSELPKLSTYRGKVLLSFPSIDKDPRVAWRIPEVRRYVAALAAAMPYFPYYLCPDPRAGAFVFYFGSLADLEAGVGENGINLLHRSVLAALTNALVAIVGLCPRLGDDPSRACRDILQAAPEEVRSMMLRSIGLEKRHG
jgi:hypothetical protein